MKKQKFVGPEHEALDRYLIKNNMRRSYERSIILERIIALDSHFTPQALNDYINKELPISRTSVYNAIETFIKADLLVRHPVMNEAALYELKTRSDKHHHMICTSCGAIFEFTDTKLDKALARRVHASFVKTHRALYFYGLCYDCSPKPSPKRKIKKV